MTMRTLLEDLYPERAAELFETITAIAVDTQEKLQQKNFKSTERNFSEQSALLIAYADHMAVAGTRGFSGLETFLLQQELDQAFSHIHLLPFFPSTSDDGFAVQDFEAVGTVDSDWEDVRSLGAHISLGFDLVINHISSKHPWFESALKGDPKYGDFFHFFDEPPSTEGIVRPRALPLFHAYETDDGQTIYAWTTFSRDQVDLNFSNPEVLLEMLRVFLFYIRQGSQLTRMDAIAYLWKELGTPCIHHPFTYKLVYLFRELVDTYFPEHVLLTETNVPQEENFSYFGQGSQKGAHLVYQFSLPPLALHCLLEGNVSPLVHWIRNLPALDADQTFLNFVASHDGIGVRPLEGLVAAEKVQHLVEHVQKKGGYVSFRSHSDGRQTPYELNISLAAAVDFLDDPSDLKAFFSVHMLAMSLPGVPAVYFSSLFAAPNNREEAEETQIPRRINRKKFCWERLDQEAPLFERSLDFFKRALAFRSQHVAFHPQAQTLAQTRQGNAVLEVMRQYKKSRLIFWMNATSEPQTFANPYPTFQQVFQTTTPSQDAAALNNQINLRPYESIWLITDSEST